VAAVMTMTFIDCN